MLKEKLAGVWYNVDDVKKKTNGTWSDCKWVEKKYNGSWTIIYPSSTFAVRKISFETNSSFYGIDTYTSISNPFTTATVTDLGSCLEITASGGATKPESTDTKYYGVGFGNTIIDRDGIAPFWLFIDQEIIGSDKASVRAILTADGFYMPYVVDKADFKSRRETISFYVPEYYGSAFSVYFIIYSERSNFTGSTSKPSATARIYGMWNSGRRYDLSIFRH